LRQDPITVGACPCQIVIADEMPWPQGVVGRNADRPRGLQEFRDRRDSASLNLNGDSAFRVNGFGQSSWQSRVTESDGRVGGTNRRGDDDMVRQKLSYFAGTVTEKKFISAADVKLLACHVLEGGVFNRLEAEALMALDRSVEAHESWAGVYSTLIVNFVVRRSLPVGIVTADDALWLTSVLDLGGPTETAINIAYAILDEAQHVDIAILDFIMRGRQQARLQKLAA
jgi:hypothetical protein